MRHNHWQNHKWFRFWKIHFEKKSSNTCDTNSFKKKKNNFQLLQFNFVLNFVQNNVVYLPTTNWPHNKEKCFSYCKTLDLKIPMALGQSTTQPSCYNNCPNVVIQFILYRKKNIVNSLSLSKNTHFKIIFLKFFILFWNRYT